jgi:hypothetical protein
MSDGVYYAYLGALVLSAVVLAVVAARGSGQAPALRVLAAVVAAGFLGYAGYLVIASPATVTVVYYAFALPVLALINFVRSRRRRRSDSATPLPYAGEAGPVRPGFGPQPPVASQPGFGTQPDFTSQPGSASQPGFGAQQSGFGPQHASFETPQPGLHPPPNVPGQTAGFPAPPAFASAAGFPQQQAAFAPHSAAVTQQVPFPAQPAEFSQQMPLSAAFPQQRGGLHPQSPAFAGSPAGFPQRRASLSPQQAAFAQPRAGFAQAPGQHPGEFSDGQPVSPAAPASPPPSGFTSAAALFAPPPQPVSPAAPAVDPGTYGALPSGLFGGQAADHELPSARPSGLPSAAPEPSPATPAHLSARPSGLPSRRVPTRLEPGFAAPVQQEPEASPAHVEFTQKLVLQEPAPMRDVPAGPQPLYPQYPAQSFESAPERQFHRQRAEPSDGPGPHLLPGRQEQRYQEQRYQEQRYQEQRYQEQRYQEQGYQEQGYQEQGYQEQQQEEELAHPEQQGLGHRLEGHRELGSSRHGYPEQGKSRHGYPHAGYSAIGQPNAGYEPTAEDAIQDRPGRHGAHQRASESRTYEVPDAPTTGYEPNGYRPAHAEQHATASGYGSPEYAQGPPRHRQPETHPADWPPRRA